MGMLHGGASLDFAARKPLDEYSDKNAMTAPGPRKSLLKHQNMGGSGFNTSFY
jgi:hypothetical protein